MGTYLITYDLHRERNYLPLYGLLHEWKAIRLTESNWLAVLKGPAATIREIVSGRLDGDDTVTVLELKMGSDWATLRVSQSSVDWLSHFVTPAQSPAPTAPMLPPAPVAWPGANPFGRPRTLADLAGIGVRA